MFFRTALKMDLIIFWAKRRRLKKNNKVVLYWTGQPWWVRRNHFCCLILILKSWFAFDAIVCVCLLTGGNCIVQPHTRNFFMSMEVPWRESSPLFFSFCQFFVSPDTRKKERHLILIAFPTSSFSSPQRQWEGIEENGEREGGSGDKGHPSPDTQSATAWQSCDIWSADDIRRSRPRGAAYWRTQSFRWHEPRVADTTSFNFKSSPHQRS